MNQQLAIDVSDTSQIGESRRAAALVSNRAGLDETQAGKVAIIVTELATNLVRYAKDGTILLRGQSAEGEGPTVEIWSIDSGPGFDVGRALKDGFSTGGTAGNGLGAIQRLASTFDLYSIQPAGTVIAARVTNSLGSSNDAPESFQCSCISRPAPRETACGDAWRLAKRPDSFAFMIADGLGHGPDAAAAADLAASAFDKDPFADVNAVIESLHRATSGTRGAVVAIANLDRCRRLLRYSGVGNISGTLFSPGTRQGLSSHNGIVGSRLPRLKAFEYELPSSGILIMHSDGLQTRWTLEAYPGLAQRHPAVIAGVLFRDFYRDRDDVTILIGAWRDGGTK